MMDGLKDVHRAAIIATIAANARVERAVLFGSRATGSNTVSSDVDIALFGDRLTLTDQAHLAVALDEIPMAQSVDLVLYDSIHDGTLREHIRRQGVEWYAPPPRDEAYNTSSDSASEWPVVTVEDLSERVAMGPFGSSIKVSTFVPDGIPIISGKHLRGVRVDDAPGFNFITHDHAKRLANANVRRGDVIFTHAGNIGQVAYVPEESRFDRYVISQRQFYMRCDTSKAIPEFVALYFTSAEGQHQLLANASQVGVPSIAQPVTYLRMLQIHLPPLSEQRAIAHILGTLDDKIELNRRMNATLESMARALFRSWFVDFDPVRAKMEGRDTGLPKDIADLFPDRLVNSKLEETPEGWESARLTDLMEVNPKRPLPRGRIAPYVDMASMPTRGHVPESIVERPFGSGMRFVNGDTLVARITPCLENGKTAYVDFLRDDEVGWGSTEFIVLRPMPPLPAPFAYCLARSTRFREFAVQNMSGTSGRQRVPAAALGEFMMAAPPKGIAARFGQVARSLLERASRAAAESRVLATARDALLPKLVSGEIRARDAEKAVGDIA